MFYSLFYLDSGCHECHHAERRVDHCRCHSGPRDVGCYACCGSSGPADIVVTVHHNHDLVYVHPRAVFLFEVHRQAGRVRYSVAATAQRVHLHNNILIGFRTYSVDVDGRDFSVEDKEHRVFDRLPIQLDLHISRHEIVSSSESAIRAGHHILVFHRLLRYRYTVRSILRTRNQRQNLTRSARIVEQWARS